MMLPDAVALAGLPLHVLVRDFPETLAVFRRFGLAVPERGGESFAAAAGADAAALYDALVRVTAWRDGAKAGPCERAAVHAAAQRAETAREAGPTT